MSKLKKNERGIQFPLPDEVHKKVEKAIFEINKDPRNNISKKSFCETAVDHLLKNYKTVWNLKEGK